MFNQFSVEKFLDFERKNGLFLRKFYEINYWSYIRLGIYHEIYQNKYLVKPNQSSLYHYTRYEKIKVLLNNILWSLARNPFLYGRKKGLLIFNQQRRIKINNEYLDPLFETWIKEEKRLTHIMLEDNYFGSHFPVSNKRDLYYLDYFVLLRKIIRTFIKIDVSELAGEILGIIEEEFDVKIDKKQLTFKLRSLYIEHRYLKGLYRKLLIRYKPKAILLNCYYSFTKMVFIELAHELKIPTIEFQHGTMGKGHLGYNFPEGLIVNTFPDYVFVWGNFWKEVTRFPIEKNRVIVTGYPFFEKRIIEEKNNSKPNNDLIPVILFISQNTIGNQLSKIAVDLSLKLRDDYRIIYKLHPGEYYKWKKKYPWLEESDIEVVESNEKEIYKLFAEADVQIGVYSTALYEGLGFGLLTIIVELPFSNLMEDVYQLGYVEKAINVDGIIEILYNQRHKVNLNKSDFWEKDSINKIIKNLYFIINNQNI